MANTCEDVIHIFKIRNMHNLNAVIKKGLDSICPKLSFSDSVVIKPNLCAIKTPETGATTDPKIVEEIILYLQNEFGISDITIVESDGTQVLADVAFKLLGYEKLSTRLNVKLTNLSRSPSSIRVFPKNLFLKKIRVPQVMENADFFISIPKIKTHGYCFFSAALKNQYGCNPYPRKWIYHKRLDAAIVDLNAIFKPDLVVVDGIVAMEGCGGPINGTPVKMNTILFGRDPVSVDHLISRIMGMNPDSARYIVEAKRMGLGTTNYRTAGINPNEIKRKFKNTPPQLRNLYGLFQNLS